MEDMTIGQMQQMQYELWDKHKDRWTPLEPEYARSQFLWMIGEIGEVLDIIKKCGEEGIMAEPQVRAAFVEELCDVLMYFGDILLRYQITPREIASAYVKKHAKNMGRDYQEEESSFASQLGAP